MSHTSALLVWYNANKRDLPWRHTRDPYSVWLSEVILQQTRVNQGLHYYYRFLELFPTVVDLANASEDEVLKAWQGLGYYSRARNLHASAKWVAYVAEGVFPQSAAELKKLKGVGEYTAAAIASFCFDECVPVIDGNVQRVVSRVMAIDDPVDKPQGHKRIAEVLYQWIDRKNPAQFNQAIMEFGALQCTPRNPDCERCPFRSNCLAFAAGRVHEFPLKAVKTKVSDVWMYYFVVVHGSDVLVRHRMHSGIWKGLYDFPSCDSDSALEIGDVLNQWREERMPDGELQMRSQPVELLHVLSHRRVHAVFIEVGTSVKINPIAGERWESIERFSSLGVSRLVDRYIAEYSQALKGME